MNGIAQLGAGKRLGSRQTLLRNPNVAQSNLSHNCALQIGCAAGILNFSFNQEVGGYQCGAFAFVILFC